MKRILFLFLWMCMLSSCMWHKEDSTELQQSYAAKYIELTSRENGDELEYLSGGLSFSGQCQDHFYFLFQRRYDVYDTEQIFEEKAIGAPGILFLNRSTHTMEVRPVSGEFIQNMTQDNVDVALAENPYLTVSRVRKKLEKTFDFTQFSMAEDGRIAAITCTSEDGSPDSAMEDTLMIWDAQGNRLLTKPLSDLYPSAGGTVFTICFSGDGVLFLASPRMLYTLDMQGDILYSAEIPEPTMEYRCPLYWKDGSIYIQYFSQRNGVCYRRYDIETQCFDNTSAFPFAIDDEHMVLGGGHDFYFYDQTGLYGYDAGMEKPQQLLAWLPLGIAGNTIQNVHILSQDEIYIYIVDRNGLAELVSLYPAETAEKTELVIACEESVISAQKNRLDNSAALFNKRNEGCVVRVEYYTLDIDAPYALGEQVARDMAMGKQIDLIVFCNLLSPDYFINLQLLGDWYPFIKNDKVYTEDAFLPCILNPFTQADGTLPVLTTDYTIAAFVGKSKNLGGMKSWNYTSCKNYIDRMEIKQKLLRFSNLQETGAEDYMLSELLPAVLDNYVDISTGACHFDCDSFRQFLQLCKDVPIEQNLVKDINRLMNPMDDWTSYYLNDEVVFLQSISGVQVNQYTTVGSIEDIIGIRNCCFDQEALTWIGYPQPDDCNGGSGYAVSPYMQFGLVDTSEQKNYAWEFVKTYIALQSDIQIKADFSYLTPQLPCTYAGFYQYLEEAKHHKYYKTGTTVSRDHGYSQFYVTDTDIAVLTNLVEHADLRYSSHDLILSMIKEEASYYYSGVHSLDETVKRIQSRVGLYMSEQHG